MAYKPDIGDTRESPANEIIDILVERGSKVDYFDSYVKEFSTDNNKLVSVDQDKKLDNYDMILLS